MPDSHILLKQLGSRPIVLMAQDEHAYYSLRAFAVAMAIALTLAPYLPFRGPVRVQNSICVTALEHAIAAPEQLQHGQK